MKIPFTKAEGAGNDFLLTWESDAPADGHAALARAICDRHRGVGADGWYVVRPEDGAECHAAISLHNADGSYAELSGNGTRCAAAMLVDGGLADERVLIRTGAGVRELRLLEREDLLFRFEMRMGRPAFSGEDLRRPLNLARGETEVSVIDVGNPQCAVVVEEFPEDWERTAAEIEGHGYFPRRTNVSFVKVVDRHTVEARFYERGAGVTLSSGTGSLGAAVAAIARGLAESPVRVLTPAGPLDLRWDDDVYLVGPARIVARGEFYG